MTTTPDNHQTPEQAYDRWRNHRINRELAGAIGDYAAADGHAEHELAAAIAFVRSCLPAALPSPASDKGKCPFSPGVCNDPKCPDCGPLVASAHPPASEAERPKCHVCDDTGRLPDDLFPKQVDRRCGCRVGRTVPAPAAPTPAGAGSDARALLQRWKDMAENDEAGRSPLYYETVAYLGRPTPPPAPASKGDDILWLLENRHDGRNGWTDEQVYAEAAREIRRLRAAPLSVAPAREGFTFPDAAVQAFLDAFAEYQRPENRFTMRPSWDRLCEAAAGVIAARVPLPQQQEDDRSWEKGCGVRANGVVSYPSTTSSTGFVYLVPDGRWLTYDQWLSLTPPSNHFPSESAARAALAKAPRPTP